MDTLIQYYMEETEDLLQKAEECLIRLESEYSPADINELFRIAHTIKGSSQLVGYEDIGNVMHKIEDMLDCARNGSILFNQNIVSLCFEGLDIVKKMLQYKKEQGPEEMIHELSNAALRVQEMVEAYILTNKKEEKNIDNEQAATLGMISSLLSKEPKGKNKYYITFFIEEDAPMVSPVIIMILKSIEDIGTLVYSSVTDKYLSENAGANELKTFDIILCTDIEEAELYTYLALSYVERINIVNLTRNKLKENDYYFNNSDNTSYIAILKVFIELYKILFSQPNTFGINKEEFHMLESLHGEAVCTFDRMKNKKNISAFINDFNEFFSSINKMYDEQLENREELYSKLNTQMIRLLERAYSYIKGKHLCRVFKPEKNNLLNRLKSFMEMMDKSSTLIMLIDLSKLDILHENEVKALIEVKKQMEARGIEIGVIAAESTARRIINIFDSIKSVEEFSLFRSEFDAFLGLLHTQDSSQRIIKKIQDVQYEQ